jgi:hypothetical protein
MEDEIDDKSTKAKKKKKRPYPFTTTVQAQVITGSFATTNTGEILGGQVSSTTTDNPDAIVNRSINDIMQNAFEPGDLRIMSSAGTALGGRLIGEELKSNSSNKGEKSPGSALSTEHEDEIRNIEEDILGGRKGSSSSLRGLSPPPPPDVSLPSENSPENKRKQWEKVKEEEQQPQSVPMENDEKPAEVIMETTDSNPKDNKKADEEDVIKKAPSEEEVEEQDENEINRKDLVRFCADLTILIQDGVAPELVYTVFNNLAMTFIAMEKYPDSLSVCDDAIEFAKV